MKIKNNYHHTLLPLRISSNRTLNQPSIKIAPKTIARLPQVIAHGHDKNIFSDTDVAGMDAVTLEINPSIPQERFFHKKTLRASAVSGIARKKAHQLGLGTTLERIATDTQNMPYGLCSQRDKQSNQNLLLSLKEKYSKKS